jgi:DNA-binding NarL/FixJ family response regulator
VSDAIEGPIRLLLVDDHASLLEPLAELFDRQPDLAVVGQAGSLTEARTLLSAGVAADVALIDLDLPDGHGTELIRDLRWRNPGAIALVLTGSHSRQEHARAVEAGAAHVLHKSTPIRRMIEAVRGLCAGEVILSPAETAAFARLLGAQQESKRHAAVVFAQLTPREREILALLAEGLGDKEIAARLSISARTVSNHVVALLGKLGVDSRLQALVFAIRHGLVHVP